MAVLSDEPGLPASDAAGVTLSSIASRWHDGDPDSRRDVGPSQGPSLKRWSIPNVRRKRDARRADETVMCTKWDVSSKIRD